MRTLSAMIVDDERVIVDGFLQLVDWDRIGVKVVATAYDGVLAMNQILALKPDLVVIDINMPLLSGLEVVRRVTPNCPGTVFIIISGYDEFQYTREALKLRVYDYLLKPVDFPSFELLVERLRQERFSLPVPEALDLGEGAPVVNQMLSYLNEHFSEDLSLKALSRQFYMHPNYLSQYFKDKTGMNYNAYLNALRIERARQLLLTSALSVGEIAQQVGYSDYRVFSKKFHAAVGETPSGYRKKARI